jgi:hypothetical protein
MMCPVPESPHAGGADEQPLRPRVVSLRDSRRGAIIAQKASEQSCEDGERRCQRAHQVCRRDGFACDVTCP